MTEKEKSSSPLAWLLKLFAAIFMALLPAMVVLFILLYVGLVPSSWVGMSFLTSLTIFLAGAAALFFSGKAKIWAYSLLAGFFVAPLTVLFSILVYLSLIPIPFIGNAAYLALTVFVVIAYIIAHFYVSRKPTAHATKNPGLITPSDKVSMPSRPSLSMLRGQATMLAAVELIEIPRSYSFPEEGKEQQDMTPRFLSVVRHLTLADIKFSLRIERNNHTTRILFLTWSDDYVMLNHQKTVLLDTLQSNLSGFRFKGIGYEGIRLPEGTMGAAVEITGIPLSIEDEMQWRGPLDSVASVLQELQNGIFQIFVEPKSVNSRELGSIESQYRRAVESSETTVTKDKVSLIHGETQESKKIVDPKSMRNAELLKRRLERMAGSHLCETRVLTASWAQKIEDADVTARRIAGALMGAVRPDTEQEDFTKSYRRNHKDLTRLLRGLPVGSASTLAPGEATVYFVLPKTDMGVDVTSRQRFSSGTKQPVKQVATPEIERFECDVPTSVKWKRRTRKVFHGHPIGENGKPIENTWIVSDPEYYDGHFLVVGTTRQGKTTSVLSMTAQLIAMGINPVVFVPTKAYDWRVLLEMFPDLRVFKAGSLVSQLGFNFWNPPSNVDLEKWVDMVIAILCLWLPNDKVITMHVEAWVYTIYRSCGWNVSEGKIGRPILLPDIVDGVLEFRKNLNYDEEVNRNFYGALVARVNSLLLKPALVRMFNTKGGLTIPELLAHPTIIEMDGLSPRERVLLMGMLTGAISEYKQANPTKKLENILILEEAHYLLGKTDLEGKTNSESRQKAVLNLIEMLRVIGGTGLGMVLIEQLPSTLVEEAMKLPVNLMIHRLKEDRETTQTLGEHAGCTDTQIQHLRGMKRGEAVIYVETEGEPKNVQILPLQHFIHDRLREDAPTDDEVRKHMEPVFEKHPALASTEALPEGIQDRFIKRTEQDVSDYSDDEAEDVSEHKILSENQGTIEDEFEFLFRNVSVTAFCKEQVSLATDEALGRLAEFLAKLSEKHLEGDRGTTVRLAERVVRENCEKNCDHIRSQLNYEILKLVSERE